MKKYLSTFLLTAGILFSFAPQASAENHIDISQQIAGKSGYSVQVSDTTLSETVGKIIKIVLGFLGTIFLALTVYAGVLWLTAAGNEENIEKANKILKTSVIGLIIILSAYTITFFVLTNLFRVTS